MTKNRRARSYALPSYANATKEQAIRDLLPHWQRGLVHAQVMLARRMRSGGGLGYIDTRTWPDYLTQRQWRSVVNQVNANLRSWRALMVIEMRRWINENVEPERRKELHLRSKNGQWWGHDDLEPAVIAIMRSHLPLPNLSRVRTMAMNGTIAQIEDSRTTTFERWVRVSLPGGHRPVRIPLGRSPHESAAAGDLANFIQVTVPEHGRLRFRVVKYSALAQPRTHGTHLGLDWGLACLVATSDGRRLGTQLFAWLRERDAELEELVKRLQSVGIKPTDSKRYRRLNSRIRSHVINEVGRILNQVADDDLRELVVEDLDFRGGGLSRRMNRLLARAGRAAFSRKLVSLTEDHGITVTEVRAEYSSRECSGCGYVDRRNRTTQAQFRCWNCSKTIHADINAARTIERRRSSLGAGSRMSKMDVLAHLDQEFEARWGTHPDRVRERQARPHSRATLPRQRAGSNSTRGFALRAEGLLDASA